MKKLIFLIAFAVVAPVFADVPYIPPQSNQAIISQAPNGSSVAYGTDHKFYSYDKNGNRVLDVGKATEYSRNLPSNQFQSSQKSAGTVTATKSHPATFTDSYGNKAGGTVRTQTRIANNAVAKGFGAIMVGTTATTHLDNLKRQGVADQISRGFSDGDWTAVAAGVGKIFDWTGFGSSVADAIYGDSTAAEAVAAPLREQALRQARADFDNAQRQQQRQQIDPNAIYTHIIVSEWYINHPTNKTVSEYIVKGEPPWTGVGQRLSSDWSVEQKTINGFTVPNKLPAEKQYVMQIHNKIISGKEAAAIQSKINIDLERYIPDQAAWEKAMEQFLNQSNANNAAITDLINALWQTGAINPQNTQTTVAGSAGDNTFVTNPYTPAGSNQAQQTQFRVNPDGSVTVNTIPRPDLPANSSAAPTRSETAKPSNDNAQNQNPGQNQGQNQNKDQQNQNQSGSNRDNNICKANPKALMCMELGDTDYKDFKLPEQKVNLSFNPLNIFASTGQCPPDTMFSIGHTTQSLSYRQICDAAVKMRPWVILFSMIVAFTIFRLTISRN